jgi:hypothetical protein
VTKTLPLSLRTLPVTRIALHGDGFHADADDTSSGRALGARARALAELAALSSAEGACRALASLVGGEDLLLHPGAQNAHRPSATDSEASQRAECSDIDGA